ncbi:MAG TPA: LysR family transcriptional regulator [Candidatus Cottocaccamicrobium excrementipullorum]|nr:LysR family transcriptional regulator [Candidatus Cottocaccamicrobium excrementipullorum]
MTLRHMKIYTAVFRSSSVTRAAAELHLAQPSVSFAIKELENYYGIRLFDRIGRRICPTEAGREFYGYASHIVSLFEDMEKRFKNWDAIGTIRIGTSITIGTHILPVLIRRYQQIFPDLKIEAVISRSREIEQDLLEGRIDIGLIETQPEAPSLCAIPFMKDSLCAIVSPDHPLAQAKTVSLTQLAQYPFLMREKGSAGREILDACFSMLQLPVHPAWESSSTQAIVKGVAEGLGVAVLPFLLVERDIREQTVRMLPLAQPLGRNLNIIYHKNKFLTPNMKAFIELCKSDKNEM